MVGKKKIYDLRIFSLVILASCTVETLTLTTLTSLQVPLPSSVFVNTTESYEVERSVGSPSFSKILYIYLF